MSLKEAIIVNWRDSKTYVGHENAIVWPILSASSDDNSDISCCLQHIGGFARHSMQGRKNSDSHAHTNAEQYYYILSGEGEVVIGGERHKVREGSVTYFPPNTPHQYLNENTDTWAEHLIITFAVERHGSSQRILNWRDATPAFGVHGDAVTWHLLESIDETEPSTNQPCLLTSYYLARQAVIRGKASDYHVHDDKEQVYYILEGHGLVITDGLVRRVSEGDTIYLPRGVGHQIINEDYDGWLSYLVVS
tara:strand:+ start:535 stop:1281 length:747 start_codon:yes stop_codon:yes gene_type:complete